MTFKEILSRVRKVHPDAGETYVKALVNDAIRDLRKYKVTRRFAKLDVVENQRFYNIGDRNSNLRVDKIHGVYYKDNENEYRKIPRLLDYQDLTNMDEA